MASEEAMLREPVASETVLTFFEPTSLRRREVVLRVDRAPAGRDLLLSALVGGRPIMLGQTAVTGFAWLPGSDVVLVAVTQLVDPETVRTRVVRVAAFRGAVEEIATVEGEVGIFASPTAPLAVLAFAQGEEMSRTVRLMGASGPPSGPLRLAPHRMIAWSAARPVAYQFGQERNYAALDFAGGRELPLSAPPPLDRSAPPQSAVLEAVTTESLASKPSPTFRSAWLQPADAEASRPDSRPMRPLPLRPALDHALVAHEASWVEVSPAGDGVAYIGQGVLMYRPLLRMSREAYQGALEAELRLAAIEKAKQSATAIHIFAADNDGALPAASAEFLKQIEPYLRNREVLEGFVYTFPGGNLGAISDPANTELGYVRVPGGRAVAFADTSVRFVPDP
jgi:hypothetical protein